MIDDEIENEQTHGFKFLSRKKSVTQLPNQGKFIDLLFKPILYVFDLLPEKFVFPLQLGDNLFVRFHAFRV
jgi:hypothetical protein